MNDNDLMKLAQMVQVKLAQMPPQPQQPPMPQPGMMPPQQPPMPMPQPGMMPQPDMMPPGMDPNAMPPMPQGMPDQGGMMQPPQMDPLLEQLLMLFGEAPAGLFSSMVEMSTEELATLAKSGQIPPEVVQVILHLRQADMGGMQEPEAGAVPQDM